MVTRWPSRRRCPKNPGNPQELPHRQDLREAATRLAKMFRRDRHQPDEPDETPAPYTSLTTEAPKASPSRNPKAIPLEYFFPDPTPGTGQVRHRPRERLHGTTRP